MFPRHIDHLAIEQEHPVFDSGDDRLDQYRVVIVRDLIEIANQCSFVMKALREIAARAEQRFDESGSAQFPEMRKRVVALMAGAAKAAMAVMQEEILAAKRRHAGAFKNPARKILVRRQCRGGGVILGIPRASPGAEMNGFGPGGNAEHEPCSAVDVAKCEIEFSAGVFRIDRLIRIRPRLSRSKFFEARHALSLTKFLCQRRN